MSLQTIFDLSNEMTINRRKLVGVQYSRSQVPITQLTPTKNPWRITVGVPGQPWATMRPIIERLDFIDRYQSEIITIGSNPKFAWLYAYQGDYFETPIDLIVDSFVGNTMVISGLGGFTPGQFVFRSGDLIQIAGKPFPFTVVNNVVYTTGFTVSVTTHRPNIITTGVSGAALNVGKNCQIQVFCPNLPTYNLSVGARSVTAAGLVNNAIVEWGDNFELYEDLRAA
jgi:hypothetical protein